MAATEEEKIILRKEESVLRFLQEKLRDQLNRLKVEEVALQKMLSTSNQPVAPKTAKLFNSSGSSSKFLDVDFQSKEMQVNETPLAELNPLDIRQMSDYDPDQIEEEEEEEEDEEEDDNNDGEENEITAMDCSSYKSNVVQEILKDEIGNDWEEEDSE